MAFVSQTSVAGSVRRMDSVADSCAAHRYGHGTPTGASLLVISRRKVVEMSLSACAAGSRRPSPLRMRHTLEAMTIQWRRIGAMIDRRRLLRAGGAAAVGIGLSRFGRPARAGAFSSQLPPDMGQTDLT